LRDGALKKIDAARLRGVQNMFMHPVHPAQLVVPLTYLILTVAAGLVARSLLFRVLRGWAVGTEGRIGDMLIESLPVVLWSIILGLHLATQNSEIPRIYLRYVPRILAVLWVASLTVASSRLVGRLVGFYGGRVTGVQSVTSITRRLAQIAVVAFGVGWLMRLFDVSLTPILTTLGVGGLAVALALQDTLSNLFAGFYVSISGFVHIGDYIKLNTGEEGYITDINWRCTIMRNANNIIVVPNNKLGQAIYTNYNLPDRRHATSVSFSVGYDSDIDRVQQVLLTETFDAAAEVKGLVADPAPTVLFNPGPAESALVFQVNFSVADFGAQAAVQSELRKRLFRRLKAENITMPFPTRTIFLEQKEHV
jgi:small-conductance mechanosensitive channel